MDDQHRTGPNRKAWNGYWGRWLPVAAYLVVVVMVGANTYQMSQTAKESHERIDRFVYQFCQEANESRRQVNVRGDILRTVLEVAIINGENQIELTQTATDAEIAEARRAIAGFREQQARIKDVELTDCNEFRKQSDNVP